MKPSNFLFHVPGAKDLYDYERQRYLFNNNWLTIDQLKEVPSEQTPEALEVIQINGNSRRKLGWVETALVSLKFGD
jgi:hypothetical protein